MPRQREVTAEGGKKRRITRESARNLVTRTGSGAKRIATAPGRKVRGKVVQVRARMKAVQWTPGKMMVEYIRFNITGLVNVSIFFLLYEVLYRINIWPEHRAVAAWAVALFLSSIESHWAHYRFTFKSGAPYLTSLRWGLTVYGTQLVLSTTSEYLLIEKWDVNHRVAWLVNTCLFGFATFACLRWLAYPPELDTEPLTTFGVATLDAEDE